MNKSHGYIDYLLEMHDEEITKKQEPITRWLYPEPHGKAKRLVLTAKMLKEFGLESFDRVGVEMTDNGQFRVWALPVYPGFVPEKRKRKKKTVDNSPENNR